MRAVATGQVDLGCAGTRVFDTMGVTSFQALQAPMLIDSYALQHAVIEGDLPREMLEGWTGSGLPASASSAAASASPSPSSNPFSARRTGAASRSAPTGQQAQAQAIRSLGATPTEVFGKTREQALKDGKLQGFEMNLLAYKHNVLADRRPLRDRQRQPVALDGRPVRQSGPPGGADRAAARMAPAGGRRRRGSLGRSGRPRRRVPCVHLQVGRSLRQRLPGRPGRAA